MNYLITLERAKELSDRINFKFKPYLDEDFDYVITQECYNNILSIDEMVSLESKEFKPPKNQTTREFAEIYSEQLEIYNNAINLQGSDLTTCIEMLDSLTLWFKSKNNLWSLIQELKIKNKTSDMNIKIKSLVDIEINDGINIDKCKIIGEIERVEITGDFNQYLISYSYSKENGELIRRDLFTLIEDEIDTQYQIVKSFLPENYNNLTEREQQLIKYKIAFKLIMSQTYNINYNDIEIIF